MKATFSFGEANGKNQDNFITLDKFLLFDRLYRGIKSSEQLAETRKNYIRLKYLDLFDYMEIELEDLIRDANYKIQEISDGALARYAPVRSESIKIAQLPKDLLKTIGGYSTLLV